MFIIDVKNFFLGLILNIYIKNNCAKHVSAMGINSLLPNLKSIQKNVNAEIFKGESVGIDAYVWLHASVFSCPIELAKNYKTARYIDYCLNRVQLLLEKGVRRVVLVFDGLHPPIKRRTNQERWQRR